MSQTYCSSCGHKHEYNLAKPKFCSNCGASLGVLAPTSSASLKRPKPKRPESEDEDETDYDYFPLLDKIEVDVETFSGPEVTLGNLLLKPTRPSTPKPQRKNLSDFVNDKKDV